MGIEMNLGSSDNQAHSVSDVFSNRIHSYENIQNSLNRFMNTANLQGNAYSAARNYTQYVLIPLLKGCILLDEALKESCSKLPEEYRSRVDVIDLSEDELNRQIMNANDMIIDYERLIDQENTKTIPNYLNITSLRNNKGNYERLKQTLERKLDKLIAFNSYSVQIFSHIDFLMDHIHQGLQHTKNVWDSNNKMISASEITLMPWASKLSTEWARRKIATNFMDFLTNPDFIENKLADIHPWLNKAFTVTKNFGNAVTKDYTKNMFLKYGNAGKRANEDFKSIWRMLKKEARENKWEWYNKLGTKWKQGSFNNVLNTLQHTVINKLSNLKIMNVKVKQISEFIGTITEPIKTTFEKIGEAIKNSKWYSKFKYFGKVARISGWISMGVDASINTITEYNNQNSRAYKDVGKSLVHTTISLIKSIGPIDGAILGSYSGVWGTVLGFVMGSVNYGLSYLAPDIKDAIYNGIQNKIDDMYDYVFNRELFLENQNNSVTGRQASTIGMIVKGGLIYGK